MDTRSRSLPALALGVLAAAASGQSVWTEVFPSVRPSKRHSHAMAFDAARGVVVMYGGSYGSTYRADTWTWNGTTWQQAVTTGGPGDKALATMVWHPERNQVLLVGGRSRLGFVMDTWAWDGKSWTQILTSGGSLRQGPQSIAYDPKRKVLVAFDGSRTSEWPGYGNWFERKTANAPNTGERGAMVYDAAAGTILLYTQGQTWTYDGTDWRRHTPAVSPPARQLTAMAYDPVAGHAILFGGYVGHELDDTWAWNGKTWSQQIAQNPPTARHSTGMAYDAVRKQIVMFGGLQGFDDTWIKNRKFGTPATATLFGSGCAGSGGTPQLVPASGSLPWIGATLVLELRSLPKSPLNAPFGLLGLSRTSWGPFQLPLDLTGLGMSGCSTYVSIEQLDALTNQFGIARWALPVPDLVPLVGKSFYIQGLVADAKANSFGAVLSNALDCQIGAR